MLLLTPQPDAATTGAATAAGHAGAAGQGRPAAAGLEKRALRAIL